MLNPEHRVGPICALITFIPKDGTSTVTLPGYVEPTILHESRNRAIIHHWEITTEYIDKRLAKMCEKASMNEEFTTIDVRVRNTIVHNVFLTDLHFNREKQQYKYIMLPTNQSYVCMEQGGVEEWFKNLFTK